MISISDLEAADTHSNLGKGTGNDMTTFREMTATL